MDMLNRIIAKKLYGGGGSGGGGNTPSGGDDWVVGDGKTRLHISILSDARMDIPLYFRQSVTNGVTINWGDGSATETLAGTGKVNTTHSYTKPGDYIIEMDVADGVNLGFGHASSSYCLLGNADQGKPIFTKALKKVEVGKGVTSIITNAFNGCHALTSVNLPEGATSIGTSAFYGCHALTSVNIPEGVTSIGTYAFNGCHALTSVNIPESVASIGSHVFYDCHALTSVNIPESVTYIDTYTFYNCHALTSVNIPESVRYIDASAFYNCHALTSVNIPESVTYIGNSTFYGCSLVTYYDFTDHTAVPTLSGTNAFSYIPSDCEIRVPAALADEWKAATNWSTYADYIVGV